MELNFSALYSQNLIWYIYICSLEKFLSMKVLLHVGMSGIRQKKRVGILRSGRCASPTVINVWRKLIAENLLSAFAREQAFASSELVLA